ncbi:MAG: hypothetical protein ACW98D_20005 [Promethearchaeota archaeon]|jgi:hypothetical protein
MKKGLIIFLGIIVLIIVIAVLGFYYFNDQDLCKKIDDETLKQKCVSCENNEDQVDCKEKVYVDFAFLKKDKSLCNDLVQEHRKRECLVNLEGAVMRGNNLPSDEILDSGGYRKIS